MHRTHAILLISLAVLAVALASCSTSNAPTQGSQNQPTTGGQQAAPSQSQTPPTPPTQQQAPAQPKRIKWSDTRASQYAYPISDAQLSSAAKRAIAGYAITRTVLDNGSIQIDLKALESQYHDQSVVVPAGDTLYFIETSYGDDSANREYNLGDDQAVLVGSDGYVVQ